MPSRLPRIALVAAALSVSVASATAAAQRIVADLTGKWAITVTLPDRSSQSMVDWKQTGDSLAGTVVLDGMGTRDIAGSTKGDTVRFVFSIDLNGQAVQVRGTGMVRDKDTMDGQLELPNGMGSFPYAAKRQP